MAIVLGFFFLIVAAFAVYSAATTANYRQLRIEAVSKTVAFESERVARIIAEMERNAIDLALAGYQFYKSEKHPSQLGASIPVENFSAFGTAVGGGIWFEPYVLDAATRRVCYYAFFDSAIGGVRYDSEFETENYDYPTQLWYTSIAAKLTGKYRSVWTVPYFENIGTVSLMTTVGAGIYDENGRFIGMSTVDWQIQSMVDRLLAIKPTENSFVLVASLPDDYILSNTHTGAALDSGTSLHDLSWYGDLLFLSGDNAGTGHFSEGEVEYIYFSRLFDNGWIFSVQIPQAEIFSEIESRNNRFSIIITGTFFLLLALVWYLLSRLINRPLYKLSSGVKELGNGNLDRQIEIRSKDEIGMLAAAFNKMTVDLKASIEQIAREHAEKERIGIELNIAARIQSSMLPCNFPAFPDRAEFDIYASMQSAKEVGGDFYDFFMIDNNTLAVVIADVSGKGIPAALFMVIAKTLIKNNAQLGKSPKETFEKVNKLLCENNNENMFVTAFMGYLNIPNGKFSFVNAGHNPPLIKHEEADFVWLPVKSGFVLGVLENKTYDQFEIELTKDDVLYLYTDGVTEAANKNKDLFSEFRLLEAVNKYKNTSLPELLESIKAEIDLFAVDEEQADDITMLALKISGNGS